ncbi:MAG: L-serine dehydratase, partial [Dokdonia sp.]
MKEKEIECISIFDMLKIGVGPSSSHTLGPWRAARRFIKKLKEDNLFDTVDRLHIDLYGSLSLTGKGHATDVAVMMGLIGSDPQTCAIDAIPTTIEKIKASKEISFDGERTVAFDPVTAIKFNRKFLPFHPNG